MKFFAWPLGLWLAARRSYAAALLAVGIGAASLLLVLPFTPLDEYVRVLLRLGRGFDQDAYTIFGLVVQAGGPELAGRIATLAAGAALLAATWRFRSFSLALAAALVLSPIVWLDYFAVAAVALAVGRPRLSAIWFLPLATWGLQGAGIGTGDTAASVRGADRLRGRVRGRVPRRARAQRSPTAPIPSRSPARLAHEGRGRARRVGGRLRRAPGRRRDLMFVVAHPGSLAVDFHHELYPEAQLVLDGENPFPPEGADLSGGPQLHLAAARGGHRRRR